MAAGDVHVFSVWVFNMTASGGASNFWLNTTIKMGIVTNATVPSVTTADPRWGTGGTTNFLTSEVTPGGNYTTGGIALTTPTSVNSTTLTQLKAVSPITLAANASNPTGAYWGIFYDATAANGKCFGYIDLGGPISLVNGLNINIAGVSSGAQILLQGTAS